MRAKVERNDGPSAAISAAGQQYGDAADDWRVIHDALPCYVFTRIPRSGADQLRPEMTVNDEDDRLLAPIGTDLTEQDRINGVVDRRGRTIRDGLWRVTHVVNRIVHIEAAIRQVSE